MAVREWAELLAGARVFDLSHPLFQGMPQSPNHPPFRMVLARRHGDMVRPDGSSAANELIVTGGHVGTHIDALSHVSFRGRLFGGVDAGEAQTGGRFRQLGVEGVPPIFCRGVLLDVAGWKGVEALPGGYGVTAEDLRATAEGEGVSVQAGDAVLVRTGWARYWGEAERFVGLTTGVPGPDASAAEWLAERGIRLTGSDTIAYEQVPPGEGHRLLPVHRILIYEHGVHICEALELEELAAARCYEFLFVALPLRIVGATGSPIRPVAIA